MKRYRPAPKSYSTGLTKKAYEGLTAYAKANGLTMSAAASMLLSSALELPSIALPPSLDQRIDDLVQRVTALKETVSRVERVLDDAMGGAATIIAGVCKE